MQFLYEPWPWYFTGVVIGLTVPALLLSGNKRLGVSSTLRHICAACYPAGLPLFRYNWKKEKWNLFFVAGVLIGGLIGGQLINTSVNVSDKTISYLSAVGVNDAKGLMPSEIFNWSALLSLKGLLMMGVGGFMVGFGTRYARGCTSGHGIFGLSALQWPSLVAIACFFIGGIMVTWFILPHILTL